MEEPLEKETAAHFSIRSWESPWTEKQAGYSHRRVGHDLVTQQQQQHGIGRGIET